jgi:hypothetical protein
MLPRWFCGMVAPPTSLRVHEMVDVKAKDLRLCFIPSVIACVLIALGNSGALAAPNCAEFFYNSDGSWSPTHPIVIGSPTGQTQMMPSDKFRPDMPGLGGRIANSLNASCRYSRTFVGPQNIPKVP